MDVEGDNAGADDLGYGIAVDGTGNAYVTGLTGSTEATFPVTAGPDLTSNGGYDAFVAKVNAAGTALVYAGYIGGAGFNQGTGIAVDGTGNAYVTGYTFSDEATFPVTAGPDLTSNGGTDAFVAKVSDDSGSGNVVLCHVTPGNPASRQTITIGASAVAAHLNHGDTLGPCVP